MEEKSFVVREQISMIEKQIQMAQERLRLDTLYFEGLRRHVQSTCSHRPEAMSSHGIASPSPAVTWYVCEDCGAEVEVRGPYVG